MKFIFGAVLGIVVAVGLTFLDAAPRSIAGDYRCSGVNNGKPYTLDLHVEPLGDASEWTWSVPDGVTFVGLAVEKDGYFGVAMLGLDVVAAAVYLFEEGTLRGNWTGGGIIETEVCTPRGRVRA